MNISHKREILYLFIGEEVLGPSEIALGLKPNVVNFTIIVHVTEMNDPPAIFYLPGLL